jgi:uncharacterized C2H2 Zn-finger protein
MALNDKKSSLECPRCSFVGKSEQSLKVHMGRAHKRQKRHSDAGMKPGRRGSACTLCGKVIKTAPALKAHMTRMHAGMSARSSSVEELPALQQQLVGLALAELADLHDACRAELKRRLAD